MISVNNSFELRDRKVFLISQIIKVMMLCKVVEI